MKLESAQLVLGQLLIHYPLAHHTANMKLIIAAAVILVVLALGAQSVSVPGRREWRQQPVERASRQQQPIAQASQESSQRVLPPPTKPAMPQVLSASNPILLLVQVEAVTPQSGSTPLRYEATYVARNRGAIHTAPLPGYSRSAASINVAPAPGTSW